MSASKELARSGETVERTVMVPKSATLPARLVTVNIAKEIAEAYPAIGKVEEIAELAAEVFGNTSEGLGIGDLTRIKVPSGDSIAFTVGDDAQKTVKGVIILMQNRMNYWEKPMEDGGQSAPDCFSRDGKTGNGWYGKGGKLAAQNPTGACETCPMSQWGEDSEGKSVPSPCKPQVAVLIMMEGKPFPVMVTVPRTSMKALRDYWKKDLFMDKMVSFAQVVTQLGLVKDENAGGVKFNRITFAAGDDLGRDVKQVMLSLGEQYRGILANIDTSMDTEAPLERSVASDSAAQAAAGFSIVDDEPPVDDIPDSWDPADAEGDYASVR